MCLSGIFWHLLARERGLIRAVAPQGGERGTDALVTHQPDVDVVEHRVALAVRVFLGALDEVLTLALGNGTQPSLDRADIRASGVHARLTGVVSATIVQSRSVSSGMSVLM